MKKEISLKSYLLDCGITKETVDILEQECIESIDAFTSLNKDHWKYLQSKLRLGQHALLLKLQDSHVCKSS